MEVRPWTPGDRVVGPADWHGEPLDHPRRRRTFVAVDDAVVVGSGTLWWSRRHPDIIFARIEIDPAMRRRRVGSAVLEVMLEHADVAPVFIVEAGAPDERFLRTHGFEPRVQSHTVRVRTDDALADLTTEPLPASVSISLETLSSEVADAYDEMYRFGHRWAGRYTPPPGEPWIDYAGEVIDGTVAVARHVGEIVGATSLHVGSLTEGTDAFLPPTGVLGDFPETSKSIILSALVDRSLRAGSALGVREFAVEYDEPYVSLTDLVRTWPTRAVRVRRGWCPA